MDASDVQQEDGMVPETSAALESCWRKLSKFLKTVLSTTEVQRSTIYTQVPLDLSARVEAPLERAAQSVCLKISIQTLICSVDRRHVQNHGRQRSKTSRIDSVENCRAASGTNFSEQQGRSNRRALQPSQ